MIDYERLNFLAGWLTEERFRAIWRLGRQKMREMDLIYPAFQFARRIGVSERTFKRWISGESFPDKHSLLVLDLGLKQILGEDWVEQIEEAEQVEVR